MEPLIDNLFDVWKNIKLSLKDFTKYIVDGNET